MATLPGIVRGSYVMPDGHWGYGLPIGGVAAFDSNLGGIVSAGGVGFDICCGVRTMLTGPSVSDILAVQRTLGSGNHYLEVQAVTAIFDSAVANVFGISVVVTIPFGSRGTWRGEGAALTRP